MARSAPTVTCSSSGSTCPPSFILACSATVAWTSSQPVAMPPPGPIRSLVGMRPDLVHRRGFSGEHVVQTPVELPRGLSTASVSSVASRRSRLARFVPRRSSPAAGASWSALGGRRPISKPLPPGPTTEPPQSVSLVCAPANPLLTESPALGHGANSPPEPYARLFSQA